MYIYDISNIRDAREVDITFITINLNSNYKHIKQNLMPSNSKLSPEALKEKEVLAAAEKATVEKTAAKGIVPETKITLEKRPIDYVWTVFIFLAFAIIAFWYILIYSARQQQHDFTRFHFSRFGFKN